MDSIYIIYNDNAHGDTTIKLKYYPDFHSVAVAFRAIISGYYGGDEAKIETCIANRYALLDDERYLILEFTKDSDLVFDTWSY